MAARRSDSASEATTPPPQLRMPGKKQNKRKIRLGKKLPISFALRNHLHLAVEFILLS
jgi:hypothetical protein